MTCAESRELLSAYLDGALVPEERAALETHVAGCAECRRELAALERTVALVRAVAPARAPAGFVDRVVAATRPTPWPARLARRLFLPWPKIPLEAAAVLLVGGLAVLIYRGSVEQHDLARFATRPPVAQQPVTPTPPAAQTGTAPVPAAAEPPATPAPLAQEPAARPTQEPATPAPAAPPPARDAGDRRFDQSAATEEGKNRAASAPPPGKLEAQAESRAAAGQDVQASRGMSERQGIEGARAKTDGGAKAQAPPAAEAKRSELLKDSKERERASGPLARIAPTAARAPDVTARLRVQNVGAAERALGELAAGVGGRQTGRRVDGDVVTVELTIPRSTATRFLREAGNLGALRVERQVTERSVLSVAITVSSERPDAP
jgi:hypothetical protein